MHRRLKCEVIFARALNSQSCSLIYKKEVYMTGNGKSANKNPLGLEINPPIFWTSAIIIIGFLIFGLINVKTVRTVSRNSVFLHGSACFSAPARE
ncbi:MAG: hypothetical protein B6I22_10310 [Desulfobacteraceae bacterium 4572_123]|nr:MAG: hypothetical protein B6I22_10310 [Desulfobacteraceae bacterium 4572_123]